MSFQERPASKKDYWTVLSDWVIRSHGSTRTHPFHPLHASFPLHEEGGEALNPRRVTVAFFEGHDTPSIFEDSWMTSPSPETRTIWKSRGKWTGFTFYSCKIVEEHGTQAGSGSVVDQHLLYSMVESIRNGKHIDYSTVIHYILTASRAVWYGYYSGLYYYNTVLLNILGIKIQYCTVTKNIGDIIQ